MEWNEINKEQDRIRLEENKKKFMALLKKKGHNSKDLKLAEIAVDKDIKDTLLLYD